jgi:uncharacterized protein (TIGR02246 family)
MNLTIPQANNNYSLYAITLDDYIQTADDKKIRAVFETMQTAWANADATAFGSCFTEDSDFVNFRGDHFKVKENNIARHVQFNNTRLYIDIKSIRFLNNELAVVHAEAAALHEFETRESSCRLFYNTNILIKENGAWKITSFHNSKKKKAGIGERIVKWLMGSKR